jgi:hypothetical protein
MIGVSDGALLHFAAWTSGREVDELRLAVTDAIARAAAAAARLGVTSYNVQAGGFFYLVRDSVVVTVLPPDTAVGCRARTLRRGCAGGADA